MRSFSHVELEYDVAMRSNIPVNILFTSLTKEQHTVLILKYCLAECDIGSAFFGIGKKYVLKKVFFGSKDCTKELKLECAYFLGQTSQFLPFRLHQ